MKKYNDMNSYELQNELKIQKKRYNKIIANEFNLDMTRGKPGLDQLELSMGLLDGKLLGTCKDKYGSDCRNYGSTEGIPEARDLFGELLDVSPEEVIVSGNSSLELMYNTIIRCMLLGVSKGAKPWGKEGTIKFLCPVPGYDRHFSICEQLNIEMINVDLREDGPDMETVEKLVGSDPSIKGIWNTPKYSNPTGIVYSDKTVERFAKMKTAADDFRIFWDNAYSVHFLGSKPADLKNILRACEAAGNPDRVFIFTSTSKITFPGAGICAMASSKSNIKYFTELIGIQTIGPDKINELRHVRFLRDYEGILQHMEKHAKKLRPKFNIVNDVLESELEGLEIADWSKPDGGYFISLNTMENCAANSVKMAAQGGVKFTKAGATFPYGKDPRDRNIRIAPTFPNLEQLINAVKVLCVCIKITALEKLINKV